MSTSLTIWSVITRLGAAGIQLPVFIVTLAGLWIARQPAAVRRWCLFVLIGILVTTATKILFFGWGLGFATLNFTGFSGHTLLATSILPMFLRWILPSDRLPVRLGAGAGGLFLGAVVGLSRVVLGAHSVSEVVGAWIIGAVVSVVGLRALVEPIDRSRLSVAAPFLLLFALGANTSTFIPTHEWEVKLSLLLSGHDKPYTRAFLLNTKEHKPVSF